MRLAITLIPALLMLGGWTGCGQIRHTPPQIVRIEIEKIVPVPADMVRLCLEYAPREQSYDEAKRLALVRLESIQLCNCKFIRISGLTRPYTAIEQAKLKVCAEMERKK